MSIRAQGFEGQGPTGPGAARDDPRLWAALAAARSTADFAQAWLALQCARTPGATGGLILLESGMAGSYSPAAIWPAGPSNIDTLKTVGDNALANAKPLIEDDPAQPGTSCLAYPVTSGELVHGVVVLAIAGASPAGLQNTLRELHWGIGWLLSLVWQHHADTQHRSGAVAGAAMDLLAAVQERETLHEAAMTFCNELSRAVQAERVALGLVVKQSVKLNAVSHGAWFRKRSDVAEALEGAMDEAYDQQGPLLYPEDEDGASGHVTLQHARLAAASGSGSLLSVPLIDRGKVLGVVTLDRKADEEPFSAADVVFCEAVAALVAPTISLKQAETRLIGGRIRAVAMDSGKALFGPRRPMAKALGIGGLLLLLLLLLPIAQFRVNADAALEGRVQRAASVPFAGFIARSEARAGDVVKQGQLLATLDDRDLRLDYARSQGEVEQFDRQYREALAKHERADMNLYGAQLHQAEAELNLIEYKLARVNIVAPIDGILVSGDVSQLVGSPVQEGEVLFQVAPLEDFRVVLKVEEGDIRYLKPGQHGRFAPTGLAGQTVPFTVSKLTSVTANEDGQNTFRVEAELDPNASAILRPGMEGIAKVAVGRRGELWIWTRGIRNWLRLFLWKWLP
jgi:hypothetical protein